MYTYNDIYIYICTNRVPFRIVLPSFFTTRDWTSWEPRNCTVISSLRNLGKNWVMMQGQFLRPLNRPTSVLSFPRAPRPPKLRRAELAFMIENLNSREINVAGSTLNKKTSISGKLPLKKNKSQTWRCVFWHFLGGKNSLTILGSETTPDFLTTRCRERSFSVRMARPARSWTWKRVQFGMKIGEKHQNQRSM